MLCDRFTDATVAYQGFGREMPLTVVRDLAGIVHGDLEPDLTLWLDAAPEVGQARRAKRGAPDRFESEKRAFFQRVREGYAALADEHRGRIVRIDAGGSRADVRREVRSCLEPFLRSHFRKDT